MPAKRKKLRTGWMLASLGLMLFSTGCTDNAALKQEMLQAAAKQEQIASYRFNGSLELHADSSLLGAGQTSPMTIALFSLLKDSKLDYSGLTSLEPARMESDVKVTPAGGSAIDIPILIKDSKLYFHMPPLNQPDEYMMLPIPSSQAGAASGANADSLKNTGKLTSELSQKLWEGIDPKWLSTAKEPVTLPGGDTGKKIVLTVDKKNEKAFSDYWTASAPSLMELLKTNGLVQAGPAADAWTTALKQIVWSAPSTVEWVVDSQGFIREQRWDVKFHIGASTNVSRVIWDQTLSELNQTPPFTKEAPAKQKSLDQLLKLVKPAPAAQK